VRAEEFEQLYAEHAEPLLGFLAYRVGDRVRAEDLLAETFEKALRARRRFDRRKGTEKTWLYAIALNCVRDASRREQVEGRALEQAAGQATEYPVDVFEEVDERDRLGRALARLSDDEQEAIALRYGADLTVPEMAKLTREKLTTIEGRLYRGLRKLRHELAGD
jgi:RNA polymerase sigma factor (sigma-70 family)